jgi:hypothetical protein
MVGNTDTKGHLGIFLANDVFVEILLYEDWIQLIVIVFGFLLDFGLVVEKGCELLYAFIANEKVTGADQLETLGATLSTDITDDLFFGHVIVRRTF